MSSFAPTFAASERTDDNMVLCGDSGGGGISDDLLAQMDEAAQTNEAPKATTRRKRGSTKVKLDSVDLDAMLQLLMAPATHGLPGASAAQYPHGLIVTGSSSTSYSSECLEKFLRAKPCMLAGCGGVRLCKGLCRNCYMVAYHRSKKQANPKCRIELCRRTPCAVGGLCRHHYDESRTRPSSKGVAKQTKTPLRQRVSERSPDALSNGSTMKKKPES